MVAAGQLADTDAAVVDVKFIGGQLIFDSAKNMTIWTDTTAGTAVKFKAEAVGASTALTQLGLATTTANTDGSVTTGTKLVAVAPVGAAATENLIGGLTNGTTYYVIVDGTKVKLATSAELATAGTAYRPDQQRGRQRSEPRHKNICQQRRRRSRQHHRAWHRSRPDHRHRSNLHSRSRRLNKRQPRHRRLSSPEHRQHDRHSRTE